MPERFYVTEQLGPRQHMTPDGFLVIEDTPIARTGFQDYLPRELPLDRYDFALAPDGIYHVERRPDEVFHPRAISSANGKPVTDDHPWEDVTADNWRALAIGDVYNPRRHGDVLICDVIIKDRSGIAQVRSGKRELSCGYDVDYYEIAPGQLEQRNIRINHVALVDRGRCGPMCAIADADCETDTRNSNEEADMPAVTTTKTTRSWKDRLLGAISKSLDEAGEEVGKNMGTDEEAEGNGPFKVENHIHMASERTDGEEKPEVERRVEKLEKEVKGISDNVKSIRDSFDTFMKGKDRRDAEAEKEGKEEDDEEEEEEKKEEKREKEKDRKARDALAATLRAEAPDASPDQVAKARDSAILEPAYRETVALAEVLAPGIRAFAFDPSQAPAKTFDSICKLRRTALDLAYGRADTRSMIEAVHGGRALDTSALTCEQTRNLFKAVGAMKRQANDARNGALSSGVAEFNGRAEAGKSARIGSLQDLQSAYDDYYSRQK